MKKLSAFITLAAMGGLLLAAKPVPGGSKLTLSPQKQELQINKSFPVEIRVNAKKNPVNTLKVTLTYPADKLKVESVDTAGSGFEIQAEQKFGDGSVVLARGTRKNLSGDHLVAKVTFKTLSVGTAEVTFGPDTTVLSSKDSKETLKDKVGATYTILP